MPTTSSVRRPVLSAAVAAIVGCAACCALPLLAAAGVGGGALTALSAYAAQSTELAIGGALVALTIGATLAQRAVRRRRSIEAGCSTECQASGGRCGASPPREA